MLQLNFLNTPPFSPQKKEEKILALLLDRDQRQI
jgi:hypothetical protein